VRGQRHAPAVLYPGKEQVPIVQEAGWAPGPVWRGAENFNPTGIRSPHRPARSQSPYTVVLCNYSCLKLIWISFPSGCSLNRRSGAACLLGLGVRVPPETFMSVSCECCVLSGRDHYDGLIACPEEFYWMWCVWVCSLNVKDEEIWTHWGFRTIKKLAWLHHAN